MKIMYIIIFIMISVNNVFSIYRPDFGKMMEQRREEIKELRKNGIPINRTIRYSENYKVYN